jgi:hypothetical protein
MYVHTSSLALWLAMSYSPRCAGIRNVSPVFHLRLCLFRSPKKKRPLPRVTVSRMLLVGRDDNFFTLRAYPAWLGGLLGLLQPVLIAGAGMLFGLILAGVVGRRLLGRAAIPAALLSLLPLGGVSAPAALVLAALIAALTWAGVFAYRRLQHRLPPASP